MNSHQRRIFTRKKHNVICPNCGDKGLHYVAPLPFGNSYIPASNGFWTCSKYYGKDGRRIE